MADMDGYCRTHLQICHPRTRDGVLILSTSGYEEFDVKAR